MKGLLNSHLLLTNKVIDNHNHNVNVSKDINFDSSENNYNH